MWYATRADAVREADGYARILRSTSVMGLASAVQAVVGLVRVKLVALLLGPSGIGVLALYTATTTLIGTLTSAGWPTSAVRALAQAHERHDDAQLAEIAAVLRHACWLSGLAGWLLMAALSPWLSDWVFASRRHAGALAMLGAVVLLGSLASGHASVLQGVQRIGDIARYNVVAAVLGTLVAVALYAGMGHAGIVPALVASAVVQLAFASHFAARVQVPHAAPTWTMTWRRLRDLSGLGLALTWSAVLMAALDLFVRTVVMRTLGVDAAGHHQAAWMLSGVFAGFILTAMAADYYPRLSAQIDDPVAATRLVNHQTEIGMLLALPGLISTLVFAPLLLSVFYSNDFRPGAALMPWFVAGVFGRIVAWPLGFVLIARGASALFAISETLFVLLQATLAFVLIGRYGLSGAALAFALSYAVYALAVFALARRLIGFRWSATVRALLALSALAAALFAVLSKHLDTRTLSIVGAAAVLLSAMLSLREVVRRLDRDHPLAARVRKAAPWLV